MESYDEKEVEAKKRSILKRAAVAGGAAVLLSGLLGLVLLQGSVDKEHVEEQTPQVEQRELPPMPGGSGSWFVSILEEA